MNEIIGEYERYPFPFNSKLGFEVPKNMPKIYVKELKTEHKTKNIEVNNFSNEQFHFSNTSAGCWYQEQIPHDVIILHSPWLQHFWGV